MKILFKVFPALLLVVALAACSRSVPQQEPVRAVKLLQVGSSGVENVQEYAAEIRARTESRIGFRVGGKLVQRQAEVGQAVKAGQLLAVIDVQDYQLGAQAAAAQVAAAQTQRDLAAADLKRYESLRDQGFVSNAEIERRQTTLKSADAALNQAKAQASVQGNQAAYTQLLADANGVVVGVDAEPGQVVAAGAPVVRLAHQGPRDAVFAVPEDRVAQFRSGLPVQVSLWASVGQAPQSWKAVVREVAASADPVTRTYTVKATLQDGKSTPPLGATATARVTRGTDKAQAAIKVPLAALWQQGQGNAVWVYDAKAQTVKARTVQVAGADAAEAVIVSGLQPGEEVVVAGVHVLSEGLTVTRYVEKH